LFQTATTTTGKQLLTHSRLACFRACPRRHLIRYELGLRPVSDDLPRRIGSAYHAALDAADRGKDPGVAITAMADAYEAAMVAQMFTGHARHYAAAWLEPVASEVEFDLPLVNPETGAATPIWRLAGKIDSIVRLQDGRLALLEYKTTSRDFAPGADYWQRLHLDQQLSIYVIAARALGHDVQTVIYDVTRRPGQRPLKATPDASRKYTARGALYANQRDTDETPDEYAARITADIEAKPEHYFARIEIARLDQDIAECAADLWDQQLALRECQRSRRWWRNPEACQTAVGACDYLPICINRDLADRTPDGYTRNVEIHPELSGAATVEG
jgi:hypothetical protein